MGGVRDRGGASHKNYGILDLGTSPAARQDAVMDAPQQLEVPWGFHLNRLYITLFVRTSFGSEVPTFSKKKLVMLQKCGDKTPHLRFVFLSHYLQGFIPCSSLLKFCLMKNGPLQNFSWLESSLLSKKRVGPWKMDGPDVGLGALGSMSYFTYLPNGVYWAYNPLILKITPKYEKTHPSVGCFVGRKLGSVGYNPNTPSISR